MSGSNAVGPVGVYDTQGVASLNNTPGVRSDASEWPDGSGLLWLFGGWGQDSAGNGGEQNDLWSYQPQ